MSDTPIPPPPEPLFEIPDGARVGAVAIPAGPHTAREVAAVIADAQLQAHLLGNVPPAGRTPDILPPLGPVETIRHLFDSLNSLDRARARAAIGIDVCPSGTPTLVSWITHGKTCAALYRDRGTAREHAKDIGGFEGVRAVACETFDMVDLTPAFGLPKAAERLGEKTAEVVEGSNGVRSASPPAANNPNAFYGKFAHPAPVDTRMGQVERTARRPTFTLDSIWPSVAPNPAADPNDRTSLATTAEPARFLRAEDRPAFWLGVSVGRSETAQHPSGVTLVFEPNLPGSERERLLALIRSLRGIAAALPAAPGGERALPATPVDWPEPARAEIARLTAEVREQAERLAVYESAVGQPDEVIEALDAAKAPRHELVSHRVRLLNRRKKARIARLKAQRDAAELTLSVTIERANRDRDVFDAFRASVESQGVDVADVASGALREMAVTAGEPQTEDTPSPIRAAVALATDSQNRAMLVFHRDRKGWELPGGKVEEGQTPAAAVRAEFFQETGLELTGWMVNDPVVFDAGPKPGAVPCKVYLFSGRAEGEPKAGGDALNAAWFAAGAVIAGFESGRLSLSDLGSREYLLRWAREQVQRDREAGARDVLAAAEQLYQELLPWFDEPRQRRDGLLTYPDVEEIRAAMTAYEKARDARRGGST